MKKKKHDFVDDGRTIANMNVDGMPWYNPAAPERTDKGSESEQHFNDTLSFKEKVAMTKGVLMAALLIGSVFAVGFLVFILFCVFIWLR